MMKKKSKPQTSIDDLPDFLLVEVLSRLPSSKFVFQCISVSKRWCTLISNDLYFISRFISLHNNQTQPYLIDGRGREFPTAKALLASSPTKFSAASKSSDHLLAPVFEKIKRFHSLDKHPVVIQTFKDLVLCCETRYYQRQYYICNPYTEQWVALPRTPSRYQSVPVGFICDPYYEDEKANGISSSSTALITVNNDYRCKVVRIAPIARRSSGGTVKIQAFQFMVEIFSFETGEWRKTSVSSPRAIEILNLVQNPGFSYNGMIYWMHNCVGLIGLGPFTNYNDVTTGSRGGVDDHNNPAFCFFDLVDERVKSINFVGVHRGCPQVWGYDEVMKELIVWELKGVGSSGTLCAQHTRVYPVDHKIDPDELRVIGFDPKDDEDILYVCNVQFDKLEMATSIAMYNIRTREWSKIIFLDDPNGNKDEYIRHRPHLFRLVFQCWPTPIPRLPQHQQIHG